MTTSALRPVFSLLKHGRLYSSAAYAKNPAAPLTKYMEEMNGVNVIVESELAPVCRMTLAVKAGARNELLSEQGVTHALRYLPGLSETLKVVCADRVLKIVSANPDVAGDVATPMSIRRHTMQWFGGVFSSTTTRELAYYSTEFIPNDVGFASSNLVFCAKRDSINPTDWQSNQKLHPQLYKDLGYVEANPTLLMTELLHQAAFRQNLGNSLFCPAAAIGSLTQEKILGFQEAMYTNDRMLLIASGVDRSDLDKLTKDIASASTSETKAGAETRSKKATYYGGELRQHYPGYETAHVSIATEGAGLSSDLLYPLEILKYALGMGSSIKWCDRMPGEMLSSAVAKKVKGPFDVSAVSFNYSDTGLIGFSCGASAEDIANVIENTIQEFRKVCKNGLSEEDFNRAKSQLQADLAFEGETLESKLTYTIETQLLDTKQPKTLDKVTLNDVNEAAKKLLSQKLSLSAVGNLICTPYLNDISSMK